MAKKTFKEKFKRYEKKYLVHISKLDELNNAFRKFLKPDIYPKSTISNLYFDTENYCMIRNSIDKSEYKEKLRMRSYDSNPNNESLVFLEIKKKFEKIIYKRRMSTTLKKGNKYLIEHKKNILEDTQIKQEIDYMFRLNSNLKPMMYIYYDRFSMQGIEDSNLRITLDYNITYRNYDLDIKNGVYGNKLLDDDLIIMEIKVSGAYPLWLTEILDKCNLYPIPFSKYGTAYKQLIERGDINNARFVV